MGGSTTGTPLTPLLRTRVLITCSWRIRVVSQQDRERMFLTRSTNVEFHMKICTLRHRIMRNYMLSSCYRIHRGIRRRYSYVMRMQAIWAIVFPLRPSFSANTDGMYSCFRTVGMFPLSVRIRINMRYGKSTGSPSEKGLKIDAETTIQYIFAREELRNSPIILYGQSLGGAVAIYLAEKHQTKVCNPLETR